MYNVEVKSIKDVNLSIFEEPQVAVFDRPEDYPDKAVARLFDNGKQTNIVMVTDDPNDLRWDIRKNTKLVWCPRGKDDVPSLVGVYL